MKTLNVQPPFPYLIATGRKSLEIRSWQTAYRGPLLIVASQTVARWKIREESWSDEFIERATRIRGAMVCVVQLIDVRLMRPGDASGACCAYQRGQYAWQLDNPALVHPRAVRGRLNLYETPDADINYIMPGEPATPLPPREEPVRVRIRVGASQPQPAFNIVKWRA